MLKTSEASTKAGPGVLLGGEPGSYSKNQLKKQPSKSVRCSDLRGLAYLGLSAQQERNLELFGQRLVRAVQVWRHIQARRLEGVQ